MKIGIISDLHIDYDIYQNFAESKNNAVESVLKEVDCLIMCGDNAKLNDGLKNHRRLLENIRSQSNIPVAFITGNHDLIGKVLRQGVTIDELKEVLNQYSKLADEYNIVHLEDNNLVLNDITVCGTYGHYDGTLSGMTFPEDNKTVLELVNNLENRTSNILSKKMLVTHSVPNKSLIGVPDGPVQDKYTPFAGSLELENMIYNIKPEWHFCGHTHAYAYSKIGVTESFNVGTTYTNFFYCIVDTFNSSVVRLEKHLKFR